MPVKGLDPIEATESNKLEQDSQVLNFASCPGDQTGTGNTGVCIQRRGQLILKHNLQKHLCSYKGKIKMSHD